MKLRRYDRYDRGGKNWRIEMAGGASIGDRAVAAGEGVGVGARFVCAGSCSNTRNRINSLYTVYISK
jgi:hypothetical protein